MLIANIVQFFLFHNIWIVDTRQTVIEVTAIGKKWLLKIPLAIAIARNLKTKYIFGGSKKEIATSPLSNELESKFR